uniref:ATP synthase subunit a n=1 Tax=Solen strictus TaxID=194331 RepID=H9M5V4_9BIVA|nr:ATP synthase F0 subunit 6 [Solen strictus]AER38721.1 ATPase subunit 6 [Solen strictus]
MLDMFSVFDYGYGVYFLGEGLVLCVSSLVGIFLVLNLFNFWAGFSDFGVFFGVVGKGGSIALKDFRVSKIGGGVLFFCSLVMYVLSSVFMGLSPFVFMLASQFAFTFSISLCLWFSIMLMTAYGGYKSMFSLYVPSSASPFDAFFIMMFEVLSHFIRPLTLSLRFSFNAITGQVLMGMLGSCVSCFILFSCGGLMFLDFGGFNSVEDSGLAVLGFMSSSSSVVVDSVGCFFSSCSNIFSHYFGVGGLLSGGLCGFGLLLFSLMELFMISMQVMLFIGLVVLYYEDIPESVN